MHRIRRSTGVGGVVEAEPAGLQTMVRGQCQLTAGKKEGTSGTQHGAGLLGKGPEIDRRF